MYNFFIEINYYELNIIFLWIFVFIKVNEIVYYKVFLILFVRWK